MEYLIGMVQSLAVAGAATIIGFDRERAFYPTVLIVIASYVLFALMGASERILVIELIVASGFLLAAVIGFKRSLWLVVAALVGTAFLILSMAHSSRILGYLIGGRVSV